MPTLRVLQCLSFDVVAGVLAGAVLAVVVTGAAPPAAWWLVLAGATWVVYVTDHLLDVSAADLQPRSQRHRFARRHHRGLAIGAGLTATACLCLAFASLPAAVLVPGAALACAAAAYLCVGQRIAGPSKELTAATIYVAGIWLAPLVLAPRVGVAVPALIAAHALGAFGNLVQFGVFELAEDKRAGYDSLARRVGVSRARRTVHGAAVAGGVAVAVALVAGGAAVRPAALVLVPVVAMPWALCAGQRYFSRHGRYRVAGDLVFVLLAAPALWSG